MMLWQAASDLNPEIERILRAAGWFPGRSIDPMGWIAQLECEGLHASDAAVAALCELGGLRVDPPDRVGAVIKPQPFDFLPLDVASGEAERFLTWEAQAGTSLFPLGTAYSWAMLLIDPSGRVLVALVEEMFVVGATLEEALEVLAIGSRILPPLECGQPERERP